MKENQKLDIKMCNRSRLVNKKACNVTLTVTDLSPLSITHLNSLLKQDCDVRAVFLSYVTPCAL